jgi:hypothetical protein
LIGFVDGVVKHGVIRSVPTRTVNCIILTLDCGFVDSVVKHGQFTVLVSTLLITPCLSTLSTKPVKC